MQTRYFLMMNNEKRLTLLGALWRPWNGRFSYSPGSVNGSPAAEDLSGSAKKSKNIKI